MVDEAVTKKGKGKGAKKAAAVDEEELGEEGVEVGGGGRGGEVRGRGGGGSLFYLGEVPSESWRGVVVRGWSEGHFFVGRSRGGSLRCRVTCGGGNLGLAFAWPGLLTLCACMSTWLDVPEVKWTCVRARAGRAGCCPRCGGGGGGGGCGRPAGAAQEAGGAVQSQGRRQEEACWGECQGGGEGGERSGRGGGGRPRPRGEEEVSGTLFMCCARVA